MALEDILTLPLKVAQDLLNQPLRTSASIPSFEDERDQMQFESNLPDFFRQTAEKLAQQEQIRQAQQAEFVRRSQQAQAEDVGGIIGRARTEHSNRVQQQMGQMQQQQQATDEVLARGAVEQQKQGGGGLLGKLGKITSAGEVVPKLVGDIAGKLTPDIVEDRIPQPLKSIAKQVPGQVAASMVAGPLGAAIALAAQNPDRAFSVVKKALEVDHEIGLQVAQAIFPKTSWDWNLPGFHDVNVEGIMAEVLRPSNFIPVGGPGKGGALNVAKWLAKEGLLNAAIAGGDTLRYTDDPKAVLQSMAFGFAAGAALPGSVYMGGHYFSKLANKTGTEMLAHVTEDSRRIGTIDDERFMVDYGDSFGLKAEAPSGEKMVTVYHGSGGPIEGGSLRQGSFVTTDRAAAQKYADVDARIRQAIGQDGEAQVFEFQVPESQLADVPSDATTLGSPFVLRSEQRIGGPEQLRETPASEIPAVEPTAPRGPVEQAAEAAAAEEARGGALPKKGEPRIDETGREWITKTYDDQPRVRVESNGYGEIYELQDGSFEFFDKRWANVESGPTSGVKGAIRKFDNLEDAQDALRELTDRMTAADKKINEWKDYNVTVSVKNFDHDLKEFSDIVNGEGATYEPIELKQLKDEFNSFKAMRPEDREVFLRLWGVVENTDGPLSDSDRAIVDRMNRIFEKKPKVQPLSDVEAAGIEVPPPPGALTRGNKIRLDSLDVEMRDYGRANGFNEEMTWQQYRQLVKEVGRKAPAEYEALASLDPPDFRAELKAMSDDELKNFIEYGDRQKQPAWKELNDAADEEWKWRQKGKRSPLSAEAEKIAAEAEQRGPIPTAEEDVKAQLKRWQRPVREATEVARAEQTFRPFVERTQESGGSTMNIRTGEEESIWGKYMVGDETPGEHIPYDEFSPQDVTAYIKKHQNLFLEDKRVLIGSEVVFEEGKKWVNIDAVRVTWDLDEANKWAAGLKGGHVHDFAVIDPKGIEARAAKGLDTPGSNRFPPGLKSGEAGAIAKRDNYGNPVGVGVLAKYDRRFEGFTKQEIANLFNEKSQFADIPAKKLKAVGFRDVYDDEWFEDLRAGLITGYDSTGFRVDTVRVPWESVEVKSKIRGGKGKEIIEAEFTSDETRVERFLSGEKGALDYNRIGTVVRDWVARAGEGIQRVVEYVRKLGRTLKASELGAIFAGRSKYENMSLDDILDFGGARRWFNPGESWEQWADEMGKRVGGTREQWLSHKGDIFDHVEGFQKAFGKGKQGMLTTGERFGAEAGPTTMQRLQDLFVAGRKLEQQGEFVDMAKWYDNFWKTMKQEFGDDAEMMTKIMALTQMNNGPQSGVALAMRAYMQWKMGEPISRMGNANIRNEIESLLQGKLPTQIEKGWKIGPFWEALRYGRARGRNAVAVDRWIILALGAQADDAGAAVGRLQSNGRFIRFAQQLVTDAAQDAGVSPRAFQAAIWGGFRKEWDDLLKAAGGVPQGGSNLPFEELLMRRLAEWNARSPSNFRLNTSDVAMKRLEHLDPAKFELEALQRMRADEVAKLLDTNPKNAAKLIQEMEFTDWNRKLASSHYLDSGEVPKHIQSEVVRDDIMRTAESYREQFRARIDMADDATLRSIKEVPKWQRKEIDDLLAERKRLGEMVTANTDIPAADLERVQSLGWANIPDDPTIQGNVRLALKELDGIKTEDDLIKWIRRSSNRDIVGDPEAFIGRKRPSGEFYLYAGKETQRTVPSPYWEAKSFYENRLALNVAKVKNAIKSRFPKPEEYRRRLSENLGIEEKTRLGQCGIGEASRLFGRRS